MLIDQIACSDIAPFDNICSASCYKGFQDPKGCVEPASCHPAVVRAQQRLSIAMIKIKSAV